MKKVIFLLFLFGSFVYGQQFDNIGFENTSCVNDCATQNGQMNCVDGWWSDYTSPNVVPLINVNCDPNRVCNGDNSIFLMSTSGSPGSSVRTNNPFFGLNLQSSPLINLTVNRSSNGHSTGGVRVVGRYAGQYNWDVVGFGAPNNSDVCENISILLDTSVSNYEELSFHACTASGTCHGGVGNYIVVDDIQVGGDLIKIEDNCGVISIVLDPSLNLDVGLFGAEVVAANGDDWFDENNTGAPLSIDVGQTGTYNVTVYLSYEVNGQFEFEIFELTHTITSVAALPVTISADGNVLNDLTYTIPCGENCATLSATNLENATFNTTSPVLNDLNGLFCVTDPSITSFVADITGFDSCGDPYSESVLIKIEQDCCVDTPSAEPYWSHPDCPEIVCTATTWPVVVLDGTGTPINGSDVTINWVNTDSPALPPMTGTWNYVGPQQNWEITITYDDGCEYVINYLENCCEDDIAIKAIECPPTATDILALETYAEQNKAKLQAINKYELVLSGISSLKSQKDIKDCDPCDIGFVLVYLVDSQGDPIDASIYNTILWSNGDTTPQSIAFPNTPLTVTATQVNEGYTCTYEAEYILDCEPKCEVTAPTNLRCTIFGNTTQLRWDAVTGATGYTLYIEPNNPRCCSKGNPISLLPIHLTGNVFNIPSNFNYPCFAWKVVAKCEGEQTSPASDYQCFNAKTTCPIIGLDDGDTHEGDTVESDGSVKDKVAIYPNPNNGIMNIKLTTTNDASIKLNIYKFDGTLINTIDNLKTNRGNLDLNLNLTSKLNRGIYFFVFNIGENTISKKVMIE